MPHISRWFRRALAWWILVGLSMLAVTATLGLVEWLARGGLTTGVKPLRLVTGLLWSNRVLALAYLGVFLLFARACVAWPVIDRTRTSP